MDDEPRERVPFSDPLHQEVHEFLVEEAALLDERRYEEWFALFTEDVVYRMPVRVTTGTGTDPGGLAEMDHFLEDSYSLRKRVERLYTEYAWTEDPPSRVRHYLTNVRTWKIDDSPDEVLVRSYVLLFRSRGDAREPELVSAERTDRLRRIDGAWRIAKRDILVDEAVLRTQNLAIFL
jgi:phthalate 3,4-dioxygenase subunit beta